MTDLFALLCVMFPCVFVTFPYSVSSQVWYLIVSIPDLCLLFTLNSKPHVHPAETAPPSVHFDHSGEKKIFSFIIQTKKSHCSSMEYIVYVAINIDNVMN